MNLEFKKIFGSIEDLRVDCTKLHKLLDIIEILNKRKVEKVHDHGRIETRRYTLISARDSMLFQIR